MATPVLQQTRQRKMIYFGAIIALFTLSLMHREFVIKPQALYLQLRETARGEVELTSSAVRLLLTGSRGLAVTLLWYNAMDKQKKNEWHELELIVKSITKLQPYFITPWLYQSWNIAFNVAVESDQPRDKYYYISRGLELLAEGERRNRGTGDDYADDDKDRAIYPGNPELRHFMGFTYQLKIGSSDERLTMRCLLEMSCIDPIERRPERFWLASSPGKVNMEELSRFTAKYPRLIRRLREALLYDPGDIVRFLERNQKIPHRFQEVGKDVKQSELKRPQEQFPILPPPKEEDWPDPRERTYRIDESIDVFLVSRTWYEFAQLPLPPPSRNPGPVVLDYDKRKYRLPKQMMAQIFRQYPARGQVFVAETLEQEGFFDSEGWIVKDWFDNVTDNKAVGREAKYHSGRAWKKGYDLYRKYGIRNGLYITPDEMAELNKQADVYRKARKIEAGQLPQIRADDRQGELGKGLEAHLKLYYNNSYRTITNYDTFLYQSEGESDPLILAARKVLFQAEQRRKRSAATERMLELYEEGWRYYTLGCLKYPKFAQVSSMQEDLYEVYQKYLRASQSIHRELFKKTALGAVKQSIFPATTWVDALATCAAISKVEKTEQLANRIVPIKRTTGPLDTVCYYDGPHATEIKEKLLLSWASGLTAVQNGAVVNRIPFPNIEYLYLTRTDTPDGELPPNWRWLIVPDTRRIVANRLGLDR